MEEFYVGKEINPDSMDPEIRAMYEQLDHVADEMKKAQDSGNETLLEELKTEYEDLNAKLVMALNPQHYN